MGIIIKQSLKGSIWSYLGLVVGYINVGIIMPRFFATEQIGLLQLFVALSTIFAQFSGLGFGNVTNRLFPFFRNNEKSHNGFLFLAFITGLLGFAIIFSAFYILKPHIIESNIERSPLLTEYIGLLLPVIFFRLFYNLLDNYNKMLYDATTGAFSKDFLHKLLNLLLIIFFALGKLDFRQFFFGYIISLSMPVFPIIYVLIKRNNFKLKPNFNFLTRPLVKEMLVVAAFGLINGFSGILTANIDKIFVNQYLSLSQVGIFSVCALFATVINIPAIATQKISTGIISQAWKNENINHIQDVYSKASLNQSIIGALIFSGIIINLNNIFNILPETYSQGRWVLIIYSLGVLIRTSNTTSGAILATSKYYKVLSLIIILQVAVAFATNMFLIPRWGIIGAAIATSLTYFSRTVLITLFLKWKFNLFCYSKKHLLIIFLIIISVFIHYLLPDIDNLILNIFVRSSIIIVFYFSIIIGFRLSPDMTRLFNKTFEILKKRLK